MPITISRFTLKYNGLYTIVFLYKNKTYTRYLAIDPFDLFCLIQNEGLNADRLRNKNPNIGTSFKYGITFTKSFLNFNDDAVLVDTSFKLWVIQIRKIESNLITKLVEFLDNAE